MALQKNYSPAVTEPALAAVWQANRTYEFEPDNGQRPLYTIDTPPPTVSGKLHLGHVFSYSHADFFARFQRMRGANVYYPMGFDDNGLPTERLVVKTLGIDPRQVGRKEFARICLDFSEKAEEEYRTLWNRLGLSIDWRYSYRTISEQAQRAAQRSFIDLYQKGRIYRAKAPAIWCPECQASFAQADLEDRLRDSEFITLPFCFEDGGAIEVATTRPELLAACVAVFVHPDDPRYSALLGKSVRVPFSEQLVPVLFDPAADPEKGTGVVMCCTFGDQTDVYWWRTHHLPIIELITQDGKMTAAAGELQGMPVAEARLRIKEILGDRGLILARRSVNQSIRVHERCDTPVEFRIVEQWFVRVLDEKEQLLKLGEQIQWHPDFMRARYRAWVENLNWDWAISRQRYFGVPFPAWFCRSCQEATVASPEELPVDPLSTLPGHPCRCGGTEFEPDSDKMDTWATSAISPLIVSGWLEEPKRFSNLFPMSLRPQAHEIIRTWLFYSVVMAWYHFGCLPWSEVLISGWGIAGEGMGKISKSRGGGAVQPLEMIQRYSADAVRYWAASTSPGRDAIINEEKIQMGNRLVTKLWNVGRFSERFIVASHPVPDASAFTPADRWIIASCDRLVKGVTANLIDYEYAAARAEIENFFWRDLADNYIEMAKLRLYDSQHPAYPGACYTLSEVLKTVLKLFAPFFPYITEAVWMELFSKMEGSVSVHRSQWPTPNGITLGNELVDIDDTDVHLSDLDIGGQLVAIAGAVRRYKSEHSLSLGSELAKLQLAVSDPGLAGSLHAAEPDLLCVTRARSIEIAREITSGLLQLETESEQIKIGLLLDG